MADQTSYNNRGQPQRQYNHGRGGRYKEDSGYQDYSFEKGGNQVFKGSFGGPRSNYQEQQQYRGKQFQNSNNFNKKSRSYEKQAGWQNKQLQFDSKQLLTKLKQEKAPGQQQLTYFGDDYIINEANWLPRSSLFYQDPREYWRLYQKRMPRRPEGPLQKNQVAVWECFEQGRRYYFQALERDGSNTVMYFEIGYDGRLYRVFRPGQTMAVFRCRGTDLNVPSIVRKWFELWEFPWEAEYEVRSSNNNVEDPLLRQLREEMSHDRNKVCQIFTQLMECGKYDDRMDYNQQVFWYGEELSTKLGKAVTGKELYELFEVGKIPLDWKLVASYIQGDWQDVRRMVVSDEQQGYLLEDQQQPIYKLIWTQKNGRSYVPWKPVQTQDGTYGEFMCVHEQLNKQYWGSVGKRIRQEEDIRKMHKYLTSGQDQLRQQPFWMVFQPLEEDEGQSNGNLSDESFRPWLPLTGLGLVKRWTEGQLHNDMPVIPIDSNLAWQLSEFQHHSLLLQHWRKLKQRKIVSWKDIRDSFCLNLIEDVVRLGDLQLTPLQKLQMEERSSQQDDDQQQEIFYPVISWVKEKQ